MRMTAAPSHTHRLREPPKVAVNLSVDSALLAEARELGIPLSTTLEAALRLRVREVRHERWRAENAAAVEAYTARVAESGTFGDESRRF